MKEFVHSGVAVLVSTGDAERRPQIMYGWGPRVRDDGRTVDVFIERERAGCILANAEATGRIAMTVAMPVDHRSYQFKGAFIGTGDATDADREWVQNHRDAFVVTTSLVGDPPEAIRGLWMEDVVRISFTVERAFNQTPGPLAGQPL
jgi:hypothetical protein